MAAEESFADRIRKATVRGRSFGSDAAARLREVQLGREILPKKPGRKPKGTFNLRNWGKSSLAPILLPEHLLCGKCNHPDILLSFQHIWNSRIIGCSVVFEDFNHS